MMKKWEIIRSMPKTIWFNFKYLPIRQAIKLPIWVTYKSRINIKGKIIIDVKSVKPAMIRFGFHRVPICDYKSSSQIIISHHGTLIFKGTAHIGQGTKIYVNNDGRLILGDNFAISSNTQLNCFKEIVFGRDIQFAWDCLVMDSDTHNIFDKDDKIVNSDQTIVFGDKIWIGCRCTILKGSKIPSNTVIGAESLITKQLFKENTIIAGNPAKSIKEIGGWYL